MSVQFGMSGAKFGSGLAFTCNKKKAGAPIGLNMAELVTNDSSSGATWYDCSFKKSGDSTRRMRENYVTSFTLSGANGGPNNAVFNGPSGGKGSLFSNCQASSTGIPTGNQSMIQQYGSKGNTASACIFNKYY
jgi:hypothetical protein